MINLKLNRFLFGLASALMAILIVLILGLTALGPSTLTSRVTTGEVFEYIVTDDLFDLNISGAVWLRLYSNDSFTVNGSPAQPGEYFGYVFEETNWSGEAGSWHLVVENQAPVSISATGNLSVSLTLPSDNIPYTDYFSMGIGAVSLALAVTIVVLLISVNQRPTK